MGQRATIHLHIDQLLPDDLEKTETIINEYIDELAKTGGELTWESVDWDLFDVLDYDGEEE